jgi:hypothetical protein
LAPCSCHLPGRAPRGLRRRPSGDEAFPSLVILTRFSHSLVIADVPAEYGRRTFVMEVMVSSMAWSVSFARSFRQLDLTQSLEYLSVASTADRDNVASCMRRTFRSLDRSGSLGRSVRIRECRIARLPEVQVRGPIP